MSNKVDDFLEKLAQQAPKSNNNDFKSKNRTLEKIYLNYPGNFGRYQILPMDNVVTDFPFTTLFGTREINVPRKNLTADGQENVYNAWIRLLPKSAYIMKDATGRTVSSLTASDDQLLSQAYMLFDQLFEELDARNNREPGITGLLRKRNYTVFHGMCINKWGLNDTRTPDRQNFCGLFVCTAKGFVTAIEDNIQERTLMNGGDASWIPSIYNRQLTGRDGFLMFSISANKLQAGYSVTATHEIGRSKVLEGCSITEEDAELMVDPVYTFLGWQANKDDQTPPQQRRLFNPYLIQETITFMSQQLAAIRMAKQAGMDIMEAIERTNAEAIANQVPTNTMGQTTNDPILADMAAQSGGNSYGGSFANGPAQNPSNVVNNNTNPFETPAVAHIDPVTSAPVNNGGFGGQQAGSAPFQKPSFAQWGGGDQKKDDLPF